MENNNESKAEIMQQPIIKPTDSKEFLLSSIGQQIKEFELLQRMAKVYTSSTIVPKAYQGEGNMGNVVIALDMARRLGANPLMVMQNLHTIQGSPSWSSSFLIATVNNCGRFEPLSYEFTEGGYIGKIEYDETVWDDQVKRNVYKRQVFDGSRIKNITCVAYTVRKGSTQRLESSPVDIRTAILEGWYTKKGSKWPTMTRQMLMYRAAAWWTRVYAPDLSMGLMTTEETSDISRNVVDADFEEMPAAKAYIGFGGKPEPQTREAGKPEQDVAPAPEPEASAPTPAPVPENAPMNKETLFS